jgi:hypothetical protein
MRKTVLGVLTAVALGGVAAGAWLQVADAQTPPGGPAAPGATEGPAPGAPPGPPGPPWMHRGPHGMGGRPGEGRMHGPRTWALFYTPADRQLTGPEVQKIAEAFLLWHGNRAWKVTQVTERDDGTVSFAFATADGSPIAHFAMDRRTGRVHRLD